MKKSRNSGHTAKYFGNGSYFTYCPVCSPASVAHPMTAPRVPVNLEKLPKIARCKAGHEWVPCK